MIYCIHLYILHIFFFLNVCVIHRKKWVVMNPEHLVQVTDSSHNVFPVWVNKPVTSAQYLAWLCHCEVSNTFVHCSTIPAAHLWTLASLGICLHGSMAGCWFSSNWKNHPSGSSSASDQAFTHVSLLVPLWRVCDIKRTLRCAADCICFARCDWRCSCPWAEHLNLSGPDDLTQLSTPQNYLQNTTAWQHQLQQVNINNKTSMRNNNLVIQSLKKVSEET